MDNYPTSVAPAFNEGGGIITPFEEWWRRAREHFPTVPEEVARYWLHEHWNHSPFRWLPSRQYQFERVEWALSDINSIRSRWCDYSITNEDCMKHGEYLLSLTRYKTATFMRENLKPPAPLVVLDNCDGHLKYGVPPVPSSERGFPQGYILVEGHRRFNLCLALHQNTQLQSLPVWLMRLSAL
jgi:hypothetical protein